MAWVYLALGSNLGEPRNNIEGAISLLQTNIHDILRAPFYTSRAMGYTDQPDFINTAISGTTPLTPLQLLDFIKTIESQMGRIERFRWGPREIDIDIIFYDKIILKTDKLSIPHPHFKNRDFVLQPLLDLNLTLIDPESHKSIESLLNHLSSEKKSDLLRLT